MKYRLALHNLDLKSTPQRRAILKFLDGNRDHPSAETIYKEVKKEYPTLSYATVYNTLSKLVKGGKIQELSVDPAKKRYDPDPTPHAHFLCSSCGNLFDIVGDAAFAAKLNALNIAYLDGHRIDEMELDFKGVCRDCV